MTGKLLALDRDGVLLKLIGGQRSPRRWEEVEFRSIASHLVQIAQDFAIPIAVITNQPEVQRGLVSRQWVDAVNAWILENLPRGSGVYVCWHDDVDDCNCRKPRPGMITTALADYNLEPSDCTFVGDTWRDRQAADAAGIHYFDVSAFCDANGNVTSNHELDSLRRLLEV